MGVEWGNLHKFPCVAKRNTMTIVALCLMSTLIEVFLPSTMIIPKKPINVINNPESISQAMEWVD